MKTLTEIDLEVVKIKIQGFLYAEREVIFKKDFLPEPATKYTDEDLSLLASYLEDYEDFFDNSLGILMASKVELNDKKCIACQRCTRFCPSHALEKIGVDLVLHKDKCIKCGNCLGNCPFLALKAPETGLGVYIKNPSSDIPQVLPALYTGADLENVLRRIKDFFEENKTSDEPLSRVVERIGLEALIKYVS